MWVVFFMLLSCMLMPMVTADNSPSQPEINTRWLPDQFGENVNSYRITFADDKSYQVDLIVTHERQGVSLDVETFQSWDLIDNVRILDLQLNTSLE